MAMRRRLLQLQPLRRAIPPSPDCRLLCSPVPLAAASSSPPGTASPSPSPNLLSRSSGSAGSLLPMSARAVVPAARTAGARGADSLLPMSARAVVPVARGADLLLPMSARAVVPAARGSGSLELSSLHLSSSSGWYLSASTLLPAGAPWVPYWTSTPDGMVWMLAGANVAVYMLWRLADPKFMLNPYLIYLDIFFGGRLHTLLTSALSLDRVFMVKHFMVSIVNLCCGRLHTLLTYAFSHANASHLCNNMISLYFFGSSIAREFGPAFLLELYIGGALAGSAFYLAEMAFLAPRIKGLGGWLSHCLGASAAVNATILLDIFLHPTKVLYLHLIFPIPAALAGAGFIAIDLWRMKKGQSRVAASAHLGGAFVAALVWAKIKGWI